MTFEVKGNAVNSRQAIREEITCRIEVLDAKYFNITVEDTESDDLTDILDKLELEYRLV